MSAGRVVSTAFAVVTVAGCAVVVVGMAKADPGVQGRAAADRPIGAVAASTSIPAQLPGAVASRHPAAVRSARSATTVPVASATTAARASSAPPTSASVRSVAPAATAPSTTTSSAAATTAAPSTIAASTAVPSTTAPAPRPSPMRTTAAAATRTAAAKTATRTTAPAAVVTRHATPHATAPRRGVALPVSGYTGSATKVLTVRAAHSWSTTATLQAWVKAPGGGWLRHGTAATAHVGSDGLSRYPSESRSATPIGSFTLTQAFGANSNPGTRLPYFRTNAADWWISQSGPLYNTHQHCWSGCRFAQGSPNEHLRYETPYYNYAVVIDYNTRNSPTGVRQGKGSAFFLHVSAGEPTAGCVSIPQATLVSIMRWLGPAAHPRILIGTA